MSIIRIKGVDEFVVLVRFRVKFKLDSTVFTSIVPFLIIYLKKSKLQKSKKLNSIILTRIQCQIL